MKSKYRNRAKTIFNNNDSTSFPDSYNYNEIIASMCQLAEEVESKIATDYDKRLRNFVADLFTKQQVEELLQKQRELSVNAVLQEDPINCECGKLHVKNYSYVLRNAKLKID